MANEEGKLSKECIDGLRKYLYPHDNCLETLWNHYQRQIDENRAVYKSLEELRARSHEALNKIADLQWRMNEICNYLSVAEQKDD